MTYQAKLLTERYYYMIIELFPFIMMNYIYLLHQPKAI